MGVTPSYHPFSLGFSLRQRQRGTPIDRNLEALGKTWQDKMDELMVSWKVLAFSFLVDENGG